jgi:3-oxoacyl-ACP reductase-like protein
MSDEQENTESAEVPHEHDRDERGRFVVPEPVMVSPKPEPEPEPEPEPVKEEAAPAPTPASISKPKRKPVPAAAPASAIGDVTVSMAALVYHARSRNSASVAAVQDRLNELGHADARGDIRGWLSDGTVKALSDFQREIGLSVTGKADRDTVEALMKGTGAKISD